MEAKELRIGNYVIHPEYGVWQWQFSRDDWDYDVMEKFKPVPLTEEWLVKFGFENIDGILSFQFNPLYHNETYFEADFNRQYFYIRQREVKFKYPGVIQYVHQLQNLYFALTGNELTLTPAKEEMK